jgi:Protein of unknown function (DUF3047)
MNRIRRALLASPALCLGGCQSVPPVSAPSDDWQGFNIPGKPATQYEWSSKEGRPAWHARADRSASMWRRRLEVPADALGQVEFSWWIPRPIPGADLTRREASDSPARVIFAFGGDHGRLSMRNRMLFEMAHSLTGETPPYATLMYVWANQAPVEEVVHSSRTDRIRKLVVESGGTNLRRWRRYRRNLVADFRRAFGEAPGPLLGIALMTDADNTGSTAEAWYGAVELI